jgi:hypothetical protein
MTRSGFRLIRAAAVAFAFFAGFTVDVSPAVWQSGTVISQAEAVIGRPGTPRSVAGVARRTTRRAVRRGY